MLLDSLEKLNNVKFPIGYNIRGVAGALNKLVGKEARLQWTKE